MTELKAPAALAVAPAFPMAIMVLSTYLKPFAPEAAFGLWAFALAIQVIIVIAFVIRVVSVRQLNTVMPGWFIVFVGYVVGAVTSPAFSMQPIGTVLLYAGLVGYVLVLPVVVYRMVRLDELPASSLPSIALFTAPTSLCLVGYLAVTEAKQPSIVYVLLALSAASLLFVLANLPRIVSSGFHPGHAALTFPLVITAIAAKQTAAFLIASGATFAIPPLVVTAMDALAIGIVAYVFVRYVFHLAVPAQA